MVVTFRSTAFNASSPEKHFINTRPFGSDLANWFASELAHRNAGTEPTIRQKNFG